MFKPLVHRVGYREIYQKRTLPALISLWELRRRRSDLRKIPEFPRALHIETTSYCENKCIFCTREERKRKSQHMSEDLFKKIINECAEQKKTNLIYLFKDGDPVLHPKLPEFIRYIKQKKAAKIVGIATAANALTPELSREIIEAGIDDVFFSVDALTEEKYKKIKGTDNYGRVLKNIFDFVRIKEETKRANPRVIVKMLATDFVKEDIDLFVRSWINVADWVLIDKEINVWDGTNARVRDLISDMEIYNFKKPEVRYPCVRPWYMASIYADGKVTICPEDWDQKMIIGDINKNDLYTIWNSDEVRQIKTYHIDGNWDKLPACQLCEAYVHRNTGKWFRENREKALCHKNI